MPESATMPSMVKLDDYLALDGWTVQLPIPRDGGMLYRAFKGDSVVQAASEAELCRRIWDIERGAVKPPASTGSKSN